MIDRILIAEDDNISRMVLETQLRKWGYDVISTTNGKEALDHLMNADAPRIAILDWMMPEADGIEVCRTVREISNPDDYMYLILLTAKGQQDDVITGLEAGADDYLTKPFEPRELQSRIRAGVRIVDLQQKLIAAREALRMQATHDSLTGLPNRMLFADRLKQSIFVTSNHGGYMAVMFVDLDGFKAVNDNLGHEIGDQLLQMVSQRLRSNVRAETIARMGGDEFTLILTGLRKPSDSDMIAHRILKELGETFVIDGHEINISGSVGICVYPGGGLDSESLVRNADLAMYRAKAAGKNMSVRYEDASQSGPVECIDVAGLFESALRNSQILLHYQPRIDLARGKTVCAESLVRWLHPECGLVYPTDFLPAVIENGYIKALDEWVLRESCRNAKTWLEEGLFDGMRAAVNISSATFMSDDFTLLVRNILESTGLPSDKLVLDITENTLNMPETRDRITELIDLGIHVSIDNFGALDTLSDCLGKIRVSSIQINRFVVNRLPDDQDALDTLKKFIPAVKELGVKVAALGVETTEQVSVLRDIGCDEVQGYFLNRPVSHGEFTEILISYQQKTLAA